MLESENNCCFQNWEDCTFYDRLDNSFVACVGDNVKGPPLVHRGGDVMVPRGGGVSGRSYARKPYIGDGCYDEMMERPSWRAILNQELEKKSQFEKPYLDDDYEEMQHFYPTMNLPSVFPDQFAGPVPMVGEGQTHLPSDDAEYAGDTECFSFMECHPDNVLEIEPGDTDDICVGGMCGKEIEWTILLENPHAKITYTYDNFAPKGHFPLQPLACARIKIDADAPEGEIILIRARDVVRYEQASLEEDPLIRAALARYTQVICLVSVAECDCYKDDIFAYDTGNAATIAADSSIYITVDYGCPPFGWAVAGTGFTFGQANTDGRVNRLDASASACGAASITVTDKCGNPVTGYVRCTTGQWVQKTEYDNICVLSGTGTSTGTAGSSSCWTGADTCMSSETFELVQGYRKQTQQTCRSMQHGSRTCENSQSDACSGICDFCGLDCDNCIDPGFASCINDDAPAEGASCYCIGGLKYYEWEC